VENNMAYGIASAGIKTIFQEFFGPVEGIAVWSALQKPGFEREHVIKKARSDLYERFKFEIETHMCLPYEPQVRTAVVDSYWIDPCCVSIDRLGQPVPKSLIAFAKALPDGERAGLINAEGEPMLRCLERFHNACFLLAYGTAAGVGVAGREIAAQMLDIMLSPASDPADRALIHSLWLAAPVMERLHFRGNLSPDVVEAARQLLHAETNAYAAPEDFVLEAERRVSETIGLLFDGVEDDPELCAERLIRAALELIDEG
jgi:hypothetical protein